jgi:2-(1,2-epoxy-1,2-dihydrophenyl)acetyl-CoA isomerase
MSETVKVEKAGAITKLVLNRPAAYNALDAEMVEALATSLTTLARDDIVASRITGAGKAFCSGGDLRWVTSFPQGPAGAFHLLAARFHLAVLEIRRMAKPVVAAVNGVAAGGGFSLALACDFRVMAESAVLRQAYTSSGCRSTAVDLHAAAPVGAARALEIVAFDPAIPARQALEWGSRRRSSAMALRSTRRLGSRSASPPARCTGTGCEAAAWRRVRHAARGAARARARGARGVRRPRRRAGRAAGVRREAEACVLALISGPAGGRYAAPQCPTTSAGDGEERARAACGRPSGGEECAVAVHHSKGEEP